MELQAGAWWLNAFNPNTSEVEEVDLWELEVSLVYKENFRTGRAVAQGNPASKKPKEIKKERKKLQRTGVCERVSVAGGMVELYSVVALFWGF